MSMLSAQCDKLRNLAEQVEWEMPEASKAMRDAADTIWDLRNRLNDLIYEQAHWELANCPGCKNVADLQEALDENARLRELSETMLTCIEDDNNMRRDCWKCRAHLEFDGGSGRHFCAIKHMCKELGIEAR